MDRNNIVAFIIATSSTFLSLWTLYRFHKVKQILNKKTEKYTQEKEVHRQLLHNYVELKHLPFLKTIIPKSAENFHENLSKYCSDMCLKYNVSLNRVLDCGSGVGGLSFHLTKSFKEVIGTDISYDMIAMSQQMKQFAEFATPFSTEGGKYISLQKTNLPPNVVRNKVVFWDEDVCCLLYKCQKFDCIIIANTLTDLSSPEQCLKEIGEYVNSNGLLIIADAYNWSDGADSLFNKSETMKTLDILKQILSPYFILEEKKDLPYYIPQCSRLALVGISEITVWRKHEVENS